MGSVTIQLVSSRSEWKDFILLPWKIYADDPAWVPPLRISQWQLFDLKKHPFWAGRPAAFFLARKNGETVGRIGVFLIAEQVQNFGPGTGFFGFFESVNDEEVAGALMGKAENFLKAHHCQSIMGPFNPSIHYETGLLIEGFDDPPYLMMPHNRYWYPDLLTGLGFEKARDFFALRVAADAPIPDRMLRISDYLLRKHNLRIRNSNLKDFAAEAKIIRKLYNEAFAHHWAFFPMNEAEFEALSRDLKQIIDPELVLILEKDDQPVGFLLCLPNYNQLFKKIKDGRLFPFGLFKLLFGRKSIRTVRIILVGVQPEFQRLGLGSVIYQEIAQRILGKGYQMAEISWVVEGNAPMLNAARAIGAEQYKVYRLFRKGI